MNRATSHIEINIFFIKKIYFKNIFKTFSVSFVISFSPMWVQYNQTHKTFQHDLLFSFLSLISSIALDDFILIIFRKSFNTIYRLSNHYTIHMYSNLNKAKNPGRLTRVGRLCKGLMPLMTILLLEQLPDRTQGNALLTLLNIQ